MSVQDNPFYEIENKAVSLANLGKHNEAIILYEQILKQVPTDFEMWKNYSTSLLCVKRYDEAILAGDRSISQAKLFDGKIPQDSINTIVSLAYTNIVAAYADKGESIKSIEIAEKALKQFPKCDRLWNNHASFLINLKRFRKALKSVNKALRLNPDYDLALCNKGQIYAAINKTKKAEKYLNMAININPYNINCLFVLMQLYSRSGDTDQAKKVWNKLLVLLTPDKYAEIKKVLKIEEMSSRQGDNIDLLIADATFDMSSGNFDKALSKFERIIIEVPSNADVANALGHCLYELGKPHQAHNYFEKAVELDIDNAEAYQNLSRYYVDIQEANKAIEFANKALKLNPELDMALSNKGAGYNLIGNFDAAISCFHKALTIKPNNPVVLLNLGMALMRLNNYSDALRCFNDAIQIVPSYQAKIRIYMIECQKHIYEIVN